MATLGYICGVLALLVNALVVIDLAGAPGQTPEGVSPTTGFLAILAGALTCVVLAGGLARGAFDWVPVPAALRWMLVLGAMVALTGLALSQLKPHSAKAMLASAGLLAATTVYALLLLPQRTKLWPPWTLRVPAIVLGAMALATAATAGLNYLRVQSNIENAEQEREKYWEQQRQQDAQKAQAELRALPANATLQQILLLTHANDEATSREALRRVAQYSGLTEGVAALLALDDPWPPEAAWYIAEHMDNPGAQLGPPYAAFLERDLTRWKSEYGDGMDAGARIRSYEELLAFRVKAAARIQKNGYDLRPQLQPWRDYLGKVGGPKEVVGQLDQLLRR